jgi:hypothetical protein
VLLISTCFSTTVIPQTVEELTRASTDVVVGEAGVPQAKWNASHTMIYTITPIRIESALKGTRQGVVMVAQMGGTLDGIHTKIAGIRQFQPQEKAALFLRPSKDMPGTFVITGMMQGHFTVASDDKVTNGVSGVHAFNAKTQQLSEFAGEEMSLQTLRARVKAVAK